MATEYKFAGKKGHRQVVKTIDIHEESYQIVSKMLETGVNMTQNVYGPLINDAYNIFGGNCYGGIVIIAVHSLMSDIVHSLEKKLLLSVSGEEAFHKLIETIFPTMCYTKDEDGAGDNELRFFSTDVEEVIDVVSLCLNKKCKMAINNIREFIEDDNRPAGEIVLGVLTYLAQDGVNVNDIDNTMAN